LDPSIFFSEHATPIWAALSSITSGIGAWLLSRRTAVALVERIRIETDAEVSASETEERTAFRALLMEEVAGMRRSIRECDAAREATRERLNTALTQTLVLRATIEIMEKRVALCKKLRGPGDPQEFLENLGREAKQTSRSG
jgi:hypothetical protein